MEHTLPSPFLLSVRRLFFVLAAVPLIVLLCYFGLDAARGAPLGQALSRSLWQTPLYLMRLLQGDLGNSAAGSVTLRPLPVAEVAPASLARSRGLLGLALLIAAISGVGAGVWAAGHRRTGWSTAVFLLSLIGISTPSFFAALLLQRFVLWWGGRTGLELLPVGGFGWDAHLVLPALVLATRPFAQIFRVTFVTVESLLDRDFARTARGKGLGRRRVMLVHVLRNAAVPILTTVALSLRFSLSSLPVVEFFFGWNGAGFLLLKAIARRDDNLTVALVLSLGLLFIIVNLTLDLLYRAIDPRMGVAAQSVRRGSVRTDRLLTQIPAALWEALRRFGKRLNPGRLVRLTKARGSAPERAPGAGARALPSLVRNWPLFLGALVLVGLLLLFFFGPRVAPHSPFTTQGLVYEDGSFRIPPFAPDAIHPWGTDALGRDILSLVLVGTQQTLLLVGLAVAARLLLGLVLGVIAGWRPQSLLDRLLLRLAEVLAAFPTLLLAMILVLAVGIRRGFVAFIIALCVVGWGEIMQLVRGEVMSLRPRPFVEGAVAVGRRSVGIVTAHLLPNLVPLIIALTALEMAGVLMLLGELGFIGIFIGGGAFAELDIGAAPYHYSDVPEWGALLSNVRTYARGYPWMAFYPALAVFVAILGFNLLGEGLRRAVDRGEIGFFRRISRYGIVIVLLGALLGGWVRESVGPTAVYREQARSFSGEQALALARSLRQPSPARLGSGQMEAVSAEIARRFSDLGLQPAGEALTFFQDRTRNYQRLDRMPRLSIGDDAPDPVYRQEYAEYVGAFRNLGHAEGELVAFVPGDLLGSRNFGLISYSALRNKSYENQVLLLLSPDDLAYLRSVPIGGAVIVSSDPTAQIARQQTLSTRDPGFATAGVNRNASGDRPILWISEELADRLLAPAETSVDALRRRRTMLEQDGVLEIATGLRVALSVDGTVVERVPVRHVVGYLPGLSATLPGGGDALDSQAVLVLAQYDSPPAPPDESTAGVGDSDNGSISAVAVMLEMIRVLQESNYQPYRTLIFVAYSGEGSEGGKNVTEPAAADFLQAKYGFANNLSVEAVLRLRGVGNGSGDRLAVAGGGSRRLVRLMARSGRQMGVSVTQSEEVVDIDVIFDEGSPADSGQEAPEVSLSWQGWTELPPGVPLSTLALEQSGRVATQALMVLGRERTY